MTESNVITQSRLDNFRVILTLVLAEERYIVNEIERGARVEPGDFKAIVDPARKTLEIIRPGQPRLSSPLAREKSGLMIVPARTRKRAK